MFSSNYNFSKDDLECSEKELLKLEVELEVPVITDDVRSKVFYHCGMSKNKIGRSQEALDRATKREAKQQRYVRINQALTWLCDTYPNCFNLKDPKPLKIGIWQDILGAMKRELSSDQPGPMSVRQAIHHYTCNLLYHHAMINNSHRIDLEGQTADEITDQARTYAQGWIEVKELAKQKWQEKQKERKKEKKKLDSGPASSEEGSSAAENLQL